MAFKRYAYFNKGNKFAIVESEMSSTGGNTAVAHCTLGGYSTKDTCEAAGGQWIPSSTGSNSGAIEKYVSPRESVSDGIEIEYSYAPTFNLQSAGQNETDLHLFIGWGSDGTNLLLFTYATSDVKDLSSLFAADDWIYIKGSGRWSGLHQVKSAGSATGILTLKTRCNLKPSKITVTSNFTDTLHITAINTPNRTIINGFTDAQEYLSQPYIFVENAVDASNNGVFSVNKGVSNTDIKLTDKITISLVGDYTSTAASISNESSDEINIYNVFYEQMNVYEGIEVLQDESFELDLTEYQAQAVVYYLKAKLAEDMRDMEAREYFIKLFNKQMEKGSSSKKRGPYIAQGIF